MISFWNVKQKKSVDIDPSKVEKVVYEGVTKTGKKTVRYAFKALSPEGDKLTKFVSKDDYDAHK